MALKVDLRTDLEYECSEVELVSMFSYCRLIQTTDDVLNLFTCWTCPLSDRLDRRERDGFTDRFVMRVFGGRICEHV